MTGTASMFQDDCANRIQGTTDKLPNDAHIADTSCRLETYRTGRVGHAGAGNVTASQAQIYIIRNRAEACGFRSAKRPGRQ